MSQHNSVSAQNHAEDMVSPLTANLVCEILKLLLPWK